MNGGKEAQQQVDSKEQSTEKLKKNETKRATKLNVEVQEKANPKIQRLNQRHRNWYIGSRLCLHKIERERQSLLFPLIWLMFVL